jgi:hypothetical protein
MGLQTGPDPVALRLAAGLVFVVGAGLVFIVGLGLTLGLMVAVGAVDGDGDVLVEWRPMTDSTCSLVVSAAPVPLPCPAAWVPAEAVEIPAAAVATRVRVSAMAARRGIRRCRRCERMVCTRIPSARL